MLLFILGQTIQVVADTAGPLWKNSAQPFAKQGGKRERQTSQESKRMTQDAIRAYLQAIGRKGGQSKSPRKAAQSRANGAKRMKIDPRSAPVQPGADR